MVTTRLRLIVALVGVTAGCFGAHGDEAASGELADPDARVYCVGAAGTAVLNTGPDTDAIQLGVVGFLYDTVGSGSLGIRGPNMYLCGRDGVERHDTATVEDTFFDVPCRAVTADDRGIVVLDGDTLCEYAGDSDLAAHRPARCHGASAVERIALDDDALILAAGTGAVVRVLDRATGELVHEVTLVRDDSWLGGIDRLADGRYVVHDETGLTTYAADGRRLERMPVLQSNPRDRTNGIDGIDCRTRSYSEIFDR